MFRSKIYLLILWGLAVATAFYLYFFQRHFLHAHLASIFSASVLIGYAAYFLLGGIRGFTLIPSTYLILFGIAFFPPLPLFILTMGGTMISAACIYYFAGSLRIYESLARKHNTRVEKIRASLEKNELPIVIAWSFFPLAATDVICYVCGVMKINVKKFLLGVFIGEAACSAIYIFLGKSVLQFFHVNL